MEKNGPLSNMENYSKETLIETAGLEITLKTLSLPEPSESIRPSGSTISPSDSTLFIKDYDINPFAFA